MGYIYVAWNIVTGMGYVGKTTKTLEERKQGHLRDAFDGSHLYFHKAIRKYGSDSFEWSILYQDDDNDKEWMDWWEMKFIRQLGTKKPGGYNLSDGGEGGTGFKHTAEARRKMGESRIGRPAPNKGKHPTEEARRKMRESHLNITEETRRKMSLAGTGKKLSTLTKEKIADSHIGIRHSEETKRKLSEMNKGKKLKPFSEEHKRNMSIASVLREAKLKAEGKTKRKDPSTGRFI